MKLLRINFSVIFIVLIGASTSDAIAQSPFKIQQQFIQKVSSTAKVSNQAILINREKLQKYYQVWKKGEHLDSQALQWLRKLAEKYEVLKPDFKNKEIWLALLRRVDIVPISLVVAQSAHESDWGRSRFAREGNNYFGQHCMQLGCGLVPHSRPPGQNFEIQRFANLLGSITSYILMLNSKMSYKKFRYMREGIRQDGGNMIGLVLVDGLSSYSENPDYIKSIQNLIEHFDLEKYDGETTGAYFIASIIAEKYSLHVYQILNYSASKFFIRN